jgi:hypothetical protein
MKYARDNALPPALVSLASCNSPAVSKFGAPAVDFSLLVRNPAPYRLDFTSGQLKVSATKCGRLVQDIARE